MMHLYVLSDGADQCKVGIAGDVALRKRSIERAVKLPLALEFSAPLGARSRAVESASHVALKTTRVGGEWFRIDPEICVAVVLDVIASDVLTANGSLKDRALLKTNSDDLALDERLDKIEAWLAASGMKESRLGLLACANARAVERVRNGSGSVESLRSIIDYITRNPVVPAIQRNP